MRGKWNKYHHLMWPLSHGFHLYSVLDLVTEAELECSECWGFVLWSTGICRGGRSTQLLPLCHHNLKHYSSRLKLLPQKPLDWESDFSGVYANHVLVMCWANFTWQRPLLHAVELDVHHQQSWCSLCWSLLSASLFCYCSLSGYHHWQYEDSVSASVEKRKPPRLNRIMPLIISRQCFPET